MRGPWVDKRPHQFVGGVLREAREIREEIRRADPVRRPDTEIGAELEHRDRIHTLHSIIDDDCSRTTDTVRLTTATPTIDVPWRKS